MQQAGLLRENLRFNFLHSSTEMPPKLNSGSASKGSASKQPTITSFFRKNAPSTPSTAASSSSTPECDENAQNPGNDVECITPEGCRLSLSPPAVTSFANPFKVSAGSNLMSKTAAARNQQSATPKSASKVVKKLGAKRSRRALDSSPESPGHDSDKDPDFNATATSSSSESEEDIPEVEESDNGSHSEPESINDFSTPQKRKRGQSAKGTKRQAVTAAPKSLGKGKFPLRAAKTVTPKVKKAKSAAEVEDAGELGEMDMEMAADDGLQPLKRTHETLEFLHPDKIKDLNGVLHKEILANDEKPTTLRVPAQYLTSCTPALKQWWEMKSKYFDCVLFFKLGKFYEMYHMDADVGVKELGLIYMRGAHAHCGFPEGAMMLYANRLLDKGYKVMRVEQVLTAQQAKEQKIQPVPRETIRILTPGTRSVNTIESEIDVREDLRKGTDHSCLMVIAERMRKGPDGHDLYEYGICVMYPGSAMFYVGQFTEDRYHSKLRTLLAHHTPNEVILEKSRVSDLLSQILRSTVGSANREYLSPGREFLDAKKAVEQLIQGEYFGSAVEPQWPPALAEVLELGGSLPAPKEGCDLALKALGTCATYLRRCQIDYELMSQKNFVIYRPNVQLSNQISKDFTPKNMVLDGTTLLNLDILPRASNPHAKTLYSDMNRCKTSFGKRMLKDWITSPLFRLSDILDRQNALADISKFKLDHDREYGALVGSLRGLPDLQRLLSKVHIVGSLKRSREHPEARAVMFDDKLYSKRKVADFIATIEAFRKVSTTFRSCGKFLANSKSSLLRKLFTISNEAEDGYFPNLTPVLEEFVRAFNHKEAQETGQILPNKGVDEVYDQAFAKVEGIKGEFEKYRQSIARKFSCQVSYFSQAKNRFQLEMPDDACRNMPMNFTKKSQRKGFKRYWTEEIEKMLERLICAEEDLAAAVKDCTRRVFQKFDEHYVLWKKAVDCITTFDVLVALEEYSSNLSPSCVPTFVERKPDQRPFIDVRDGRHPLIVSTFGGGEFMPNDTFLGVGEVEEEGYNGEVLLLTGPNMGGKSTLMRQVGMICVLAQMGANVPATSCTLSPVDRIFTRIGASDNLLAGESTFLVELSETSSILQHATSDSLVLMDELGRGTATFDGTAIAAAVLDDLASRIKCRTIFATHYHSLVERFHEAPEIKLGHMGCQVENEDTEDPTKETITFLYKLVRGACAKSYGFNAAKLAGIPIEIIRRAHEQSRMLEERMKRGQIRG